MYLLMAQIIFLSLIIIIISCRIMFYINNDICSNHHLNSAGFYIDVVLLKIENFYAIKTVGVYISVISELHMIHTSSCVKTENMVVLILMRRNLFLRSVQKFHFEPCRHIYILNLLISL